jgi:uncharacterized repeat protein (TIGR03803 family)
MHQVDIAVHHFLNDSKRLFLQTVVSLHSSGKNSVSLFKGALMKAKLALTVMLITLCATFATAKTREKVIFSFNLADGNLPDAGLVADKQGNLYGTTAYNSGKYGLGNVFELSPTKSGSWKETVLHDFAGGDDGAYPLDSLIFDAAGNLYGTAQLGGQGECLNQGKLKLGCGIVFKLSPSKNGWKETVLYDFVPGKTKGVIPVGGLVFDSKGNLYGTTWAPGVSGGPLHVRGDGSRTTFWGCSLPGCGGTVYELTPTKNAWKETDIYAFTGGSDGSASQASVTFDGAGNLYGTTVYGGTTGCTSGYGCGVVFKLAPGKKRWKLSVLHHFTGAADGAYPMGSLIFDAAGNLYSTASAGGASAKGAVFELSPSGNKWTEAVLYSFSGGTDGGSPFATVIFDDKGSLYGTTSQGGDAYDSGVVYKLMPLHGHWKEQVLHTFTYGGGDGQSPVAPLVFDLKGDLYGTTQTGGAFTSHGTVFEVVP